MCYLALPSPINRLGVQKHSFTSMINDTLKLPMVLKRDGTTKQPWDGHKIMEAVRKAFVDVGKTANGELADVMTRVGQLAIEGASSPRGDDFDTFIGVEDIQTLVKRTLMDLKHYDVAEAYIKYSGQRSDARKIRKGPDPKLIGDFVQLTKYSRYQPELGRREVFEESLMRVKQQDEVYYADKMVELKPHLDFAYQQCLDRMCLPSMRRMQFGGEAVLRHHQKGYNCSFSPCNRPKFFAEALHQLLCGCGAGYSVQWRHVDALPPLAFVDTSRVIHHPIPDDIEGWSDALDALINSYIDGYYVEFAYHQIRDRGRPLKTSGGRAPGHIPLKSALENIRIVLDGAQGRNLKPIECHDIMCYAADAVYSGGVREAAMIALFSVDDGEMMNAKTGNWYAKNPQRARCNNSVVLMRSNTPKDQYLRVFKSTKQWGEPGFYFTNDCDTGCNPCVEIGLNPKLVITPDVLVKLRKWVKLRGYQMPAVKLGDVLWGWQMCNLTEVNAAKCSTPHELYDAVRAAAIIGTLQAGYTAFPYLGWVSEFICWREALLGVSMTGMMDNPSVSLDPEVQRQAAQVVVQTNAETADIIGINSAARACCIKPAGCRPWYGLVTTDSGLLTLSELFTDHEEGESWGKYKGGERAVQDNESVSITKTFDNGTSDIVKLTLSYGLTLESSPEHMWWVSAKYKGGNSRKKLPVNEWKKASEIELNDIIDVKLGTYTNAAKYKFDSFQSRSISMALKGQELTLPTHMNSNLAWLFGYLWGDGAMSPSAYRVRFSDMVKGNLDKARSIISTEFGVEVPEPKRGGNRVVWSLEFGSKRLWHWLIKQGVYKYWESDEKLNLIPQCVRRSSKEHIIAFLAGLIDADGCVSLSDSKLASKLRRGLKEVKTFDTKQVILSSAYRKFLDHVQQVSWAVGLPFGSSSNLSGKSFQGKKQMFGLTLAGGTNIESFNMLRKHCIKMSHEKLDKCLGADWHALKTPHLIIGKVVKVGVGDKTETFDVETSNHWFYAGSVKSHNSTSKLLGNVGSGIHTHHARRYFTRIKTTPGEPVFEHFKKINPHMCVTVSDTKAHIIIPTEAPAGALTRHDLTAIQFLEKVLSTQKNWVMSGTIRPNSSPGVVHNVSNTITVKKHEWDEVAEYIWAHREFFSGVSMLADTGDKEWVHAPREEIIGSADEAKWQALLKDYTPVDWTQFKEGLDVTTLGNEIACGSNGACSLQ